MLFNSYEFIFIFLPITFFLYFYLHSNVSEKASKIFLVLASLFFYSWWSIIYLPILVGSIIFNFLLGNRLSNGADNQKITLLFGIIVNLTLLGYFKYSDFFIENINYAFDSTIGLLHLTLPLAISFFTFQQIAFLVDSYKKEAQNHDFLNYSVFVTFFPQLIAGPIVHHKEMMPQFADHENKSINHHNIAKGLFVFSIGLFKKVVIADGFALWANSGFDVAQKLSLVEAWITSLAYTFQLYFDFSGYADMAIGIALLFNIKLPINFNSPYKATDIQQFWQRWHITLSRFLKDYIYIPLGGNRAGNFQTYNNLMITFILGGIWHGAGWTFLFWGILHGLALVIHRLWSRVGIKLWRWLAWLITFNFVNIAWVFFRAKEWDDAFKVLGSMFSLDYVVLPSQLASSLSFLRESVVFGKFENMIDRGQAMAFVVLGFIIVLGYKNSMEKLERFELTTKTALISSLMFISAVLSLSKMSEFLYFNF